MGSNFHPQLLDPVYLLLSWVVSRIWYPLANWSQLRICWLWMLYRCAEWPDWVSGCSDEVRRELLLQLDLLHVRHIPQLCIVLHWWLTIALLLLSWLFIVPWRICAHSRAWPQLRTIHCQLRTWRRFEFVILQQLLTPIIEWGLWIMLSELILECIDWRVYLQ